MLDINQFGDILSERGFNFYSGVPCSFLKSLINYSINNKKFLMATNESDAVAICSGAFLGGKKPVLLCQNSGLANAVSPLTSLNDIFKIPILGFVSLRGQEGIKDEPQHELMGKITTELLDLTKIRWDFLSDDINIASEQLSKASAIIEKNESFFLVVRKGIFSSLELSMSGYIDKEVAINNGQLYEQKKKTDNKQSDSIDIYNYEKGSTVATSKVPSLKRLQVLQKLTELKDKNTVFIATTGFTGRELYEVRDDGQNFYMVGSMGCASSIALGLSLAKNDKKVVAIDGDAAFLMRLSSIPTNAFYSSGNMLHIVLDNNQHESTGGQQTVSGNVDFVKVVSGLGYKRVLEITDLMKLEIEYKRWSRDSILTFFYIKILPGKKDNLGRPQIRPFEVKERLMEWLKKP